METVPKDDSVKPQPMSVKIPPLSTTIRPPIIVEGVPLLKLSPVMVKTVLSEDGVSNVSLLQDKLIS